MAKVEKRGNKYVVVNSRNGVKVSIPNTFTTESRARTRAAQVKCNVTGKCPRRR